MEIKESTNADSASENTTVQQYLMNLKIKFSTVFKIRVLNQKYVYDLASLFNCEIVLCII